MDEFGLMYRADLNSSDTHTGPVIPADPTTTRTETGGSSAQVHAEQVVQTLLMAAFFLWV